MLTIFATRHNIISLYSSHLTRRSTMAAKKTTKKVVKKAVKKPAKKTAAKKKK